MDSNKVGNDLVSATVGNWLLNERPDLISSDILDALADRINAAPEDFGLDKAKLLELEARIRKLAKSTDHEASGS